MRHLIGHLGLVGLLGLLLWAAPAGAQAPTSQPASAAAPASAGAGGAAKALKKPSKKKSPKVKLSISSRPGGASVYYGKRLLGTTPFSVEWKRDSGPIDLAVRKSGFFTVNTRIYTGDDEVLMVELTSRSKAYTLFGYKAPIKKDEPKGEDDGEEIADPETGEPGKAPGSKAPKAPASGLAPVAPRPPGSITPVAPKAP